ncbi:hypothetical protein GCM10023219_04560 [Stakelama sediminis]|uniref:FtsH-binding integral membrane protein n=1 Tax=Stakelama sediminis TaxID=463200 RepID=A0A840YUC4_9SPHN|nr:hypothetical protein [Stakelama sediminis]MBB5717170.1 FtsH-binding integral membrane protein [Stakelama sediminis]
MNPAFSSLERAAPAIAMIAVFALLWGGIVLIRRGREMRQKGVLMIVCAIVLLANVAIWTL